MSNSGEYELSRASSHPDTAAILTDDFWWDCVDETAPFGNDTGADTLAAFHKWRRFNGMAAISFLPKHLKGWEVDDSHRDLVDEEAVRAALEQDEFSVTTYDDTVIALCFAGPIVDGHFDHYLPPVTLKVIERQMLPVCIDLYADHAQEERLARLVRMREVISNRE